MPWAPRVAVVEFVAPGGAAANADKSRDGVSRFDTIPIVQGLRNAGAAVDRVRYDASFLEVARVYDALVLRADPGQLQAAGALERFDADVEELGRRGALVWPSPAARRCLGSKEALARIAHLPFGDAATVAYHTAEEMSGAAFPGVFKQARGSGGQGVWIAMRASGREGPADPDEVLVLREAADNHVETHTAREFAAFCADGAGGAAGAWASPGGYLRSGPVVRMDYLPRAREGELRFVMVGSAVHGVEPYTMSAAPGGGWVDACARPPAAATVAALRRDFAAALPGIRAALGLAELPALWTADFIAVDGRATSHVVSEFNCSCVGVSAFYAAAGPDRDLADVEPADVKAGMELCDLVGRHVVRAVRDRASAVAVVTPPPTPSTQKDFFA